MVLEAVEEVILEAVLEEVVVILEAVAILEAEEILEEDLEAAVVILEAVMAVIVVVLEAFPMLSVTEILVADSSHQTFYFEELYLLRTLSPSTTARLASLAGSRDLTAIRIILELIVDLLFLTAN